MIPLSRETNKNVYLQTLNHPKMSDFNQYQASKWLKDMFFMVKLIYVFYKSHLFLAPEDSQIDIS